MRLTIPLCFVLSALLTAQDKPPKPAAGSAGDKTPPPYLVSGRVVDAAGKPVAGVGLVSGVLDEIDSAAALESPLVRSDANGRFSTEFADTPQSEAILICAKDKASVRIIPNGAVVEIDGKKVKKVDVGTVVLRDGIEIRGTVRDEKGKAIQGARVTAVDVYQNLVQMTSNVRVVYNAYATSDADGRVRLVGVPEHGASVTVRADGYGTWSSPFVNRHTPLVALLQPTGFARGRVVDATGKPMDNARLYLYSENVDGSTSGKADKNGAFALSLPAVGRYRIRAYVARKGAGGSMSIYSDVFSRPRDDIEIRVDAVDGGAAKVRGRPAPAKVAAKDPAKAAAKAARAQRDAVLSSVRLTAIDAKSGGVIPDFKAVVVWWDPNNWAHNPEYLEGRFQSSGAKQSDGQGNLLLPAPNANEPHTGRILVKAKGYAPYVIEDLTWDENGKNVHTIKMRSESVVVGVVRDAKTGKPVVGAKVLVTDNPGVVRHYQPPLLRTQRAKASNAVTTDEKGQFRFEKLGDGKHHVYVSHDRRPDATPLTINLAVGKQHPDLEIDMPAGATLHGRIVGAALNLTWRVRIQRLQVEQQQRFGGVTYGSSLDQQSEIAAVDDAGKFTFEGLESASYLISLVIPGPGAPMDIPIEPLRLRRSTLTRDFDVSEDLPGRLTGRLTIQGAALPPGRVMLLATRVGTQPRSFYSNRPNLWGQQGTIDAAGRYSLPLREGTYHVRLIDLASSLILYQGTKEVTIESTKATEHDITAKLAMVRVTLVPENEGGTVVANRLEIRAEHPKPKNDPMAGMVFGGGTDRDQGTGLPISAGEKEVTLFLPSVLCKLLARSAAHNLDPTKNRYNFPAIGEVELTPEVGKVNRVELRVAEPELSIDK